jgi:hypothetical protein
MSWLQGHHGRMQHFVDDDAGYQQWLTIQPGGFVINTYRAPTAAYLVLHRSACKTISGRPARGSGFTGEYSKVCGTREELERFAGSLGGEAKPCRLCLRELAVASRGGGRYGPLRDFLAGRSDNVAAISFADIEALVGELPASARLQRPWWANSANVQARAWRDAGWRVQSVDQAGEQVVFARDNTRPADGGRAAAGTAYIDADVAAAVMTRAEELGLRADKLRRLIEELNDNYLRGNTYAAHALLRTLLDHIPPLLGCREFHQLVNNHRWTRGDASYVRRLDAFRLQANDALHRTISPKADLLVMDDMPPRIWTNRLLQECAAAKP